ncbi:MAG: hypothetical protein QXY49_04090 [Thermofilaceae archaeon]
MRSEAKELKLSEGGGDQIEKRILDIVSASGDAGVLQRNIWQLLNLDSRKGSKIVKRLERMGFIAREVVVHKGRKMYVLKPTPRLLRAPQLPQLLEAIPCFYCPLLASCSNEQHRVLNCEKLNEWITNGVDG